VLHDPAVVQQFAAQYLTVMALGPDRFEELMRSDIQTWGKVIKAADIKME
jgi:tripartite-type tricarboxylate transporter receptor subunit TctC